MKRRRAAEAVQKQLYSDVWDYMGWWRSLKAGLVLPLQNESANSPPTLSINDSYIKLPDKESRGCCIVTQTVEFPTKSQFVSPQGIFTFYVQKSD